MRYGSTVHGGSHEQYEEKLFPDMGNKTCQQLADEETVKTGKKWYVKNWGPVPYTGPLWNPGQKVKFECTITTDPNAVKKGD
ncbi:MAG: hypothetical protein PUP92_08835 [Rhizonema sp. PD38]|nr:hypothetical protein [Rhizonema sp. PD38]